MTDPRLADITRPLTLKDIKRFLTHLWIDEALDRYDPGPFSIYWHRWEPIWVATEAN